jgi:hypothetical protein
MSWGKAIILVFVGFAGFIGTMVAQMSRQKIDLVRDDYYQDEIAYQQHIEQMTNARPFERSELIRYDSVGQRLRVTFPDGFMSGRLLLYCPADRRQDVRWVLTKRTEQVSSVPMRGRPSGLWRVQLNWSDGQREYYTERELTRP